MTVETTLLESPEGGSALAGMCQVEGLSPEDACALVEAVRAQSGRRRRGLFDQFDKVLSSGD